MEKGIEPLNITIHLTIHFEPKVMLKPEDMVRGIVDGLRELHENASKQPFTNEKNQREEEPTCTKEKPFRGAKI
jgi:hypothetical protein